MEARHWNDSSEEENPEELGIVCVSRFTLKLAPLT